jgi:aldehyde:ferredoxin oxidoreductase
MAVNIEDVRKNRKVLAKFKYDVAPVYRGYTDKILYINLTNREFKIKDVPPLMKEKFTGGRGYGLKLLWDTVTPKTKWNDPENELIITNGPLCGITQYSGAGKALVVTLSPTTEIPIDSNVGGYFGPFLKICGFDALELQGISDKDVIIYMDGTKGEIEIFEDPGLSTDTHLLAEELTEIFADDEKGKKFVSVVSTGRAAETSLIGMLNVSFYDAKRKKVRVKQAGRGGTGTVFRHKGIKAIVAKVNDISANYKNVADLQTIIERGLRLKREIDELDDKQNEMRSKGTAHLTNIMNDYDLFPVNNFRYGSHPDAYKVHSDVYKRYFTQNIFDGCWIGCQLSCSKGVDGFTLKTGPYKGQKVLVDGPEYETAAGLGSTMGIFDPEFTIEANFYCDTYGVCSITWGNIVGFLMECYETGILNKERTGGLELNFGNKEAAMELLHQMARGEGFGKLAGMGVKKLKEYFIQQGWGDPQFLNDIAMENKGLEYSLYVSKESLAQQGGYALTNKGPQHDEAWLIFMDMVNNQIPTFEDKAEALHYFPLFRTWFSLQGLCKLPWNDIEPANNAETDEPHKIPEHVDNYVAIFSAVTGKPFSKEELILQSERVYNFQRIFNIRMGKGLREHDRQPYRAAGPVTEEEYLSRQERYDRQLKEILGLDPSTMTLQEKMAATRKYREERYEKLVDAVYYRRGWNMNGVPKIEHLKKIGMDLPELIEVVAPLQ